MRLVVSGLILIVTALDFRFGTAPRAMQIAGLVAGVLLALSVILDRFTAIGGERGPPSETERNAEEDGH